MASLRERARLLMMAERDPALQKALYTRCLNDMMFWFDWFAVTFDPRMREVFDENLGRVKEIPIGVVPFNLYPFQRDFIRDIDRLTRTKTDIGIEKCRDMGVSWSVIAWMFYHWLFTSHSEFFIGSLTAKDTDDGPGHASMFGKFRILLDYMPKWMSPKAFNDRDHNTRMKLYNPDNESIITGRAPVENFARSGRYWLIVFDEGAHWPFFAKSWASAGAVTSSSRLVISTPNGRNFFYDLISGKAQEKIHKITLPWHLNPAHDQAWYDDCKSRYAPSKFAREIEISYSESLEGRVFPYNPQIHAVNGSYVFDPSLETAVAFDFGNVSAVTFHQITPHGHLRTFKEIVFTKDGATENLAQVAAFFLNKLGLSPGEVLCAADPAGATKNNQTGFSEIDILQSHGFNPQYEKISAIRSRRVFGVTLLQSMLAQVVEGEARWRIWIDECPVLLQALQGEYRYATSDGGEQSNIIVEVHPWEDVVDTARYAAMQFVFYNKEDHMKAAPLITPMRFAI